MSQDVIAYPLTARYTVIKAKEGKDNEADKD